MTTFELPVNYNQISVFDVDLQQPFNNWSPAHVDQGFSWREGSVSFGLSEVNSAQVEIRLVKHRPDPSAVERAILVPFRKHQSRVVVTSVMAPEHEIALDAGRYGLLFEATRDGVARVVLTFFPSEADEFAVLVAAEDMSPNARIVREAEPA